MWGLSLIDQFIPWQKAFYRPSREVSLQFGIHYDAVDVEGLLPLLHQDILPLVPETIGLDTGREIRIAALPNPIEFILKQLRNYNSITLYGEKNSRGISKKELNINSNPSTKTGLINYFVEYTPDFHVFVDTVAELLGPERIRQGYLYSYDYAGLVDKRRYAGYTYKKGLKTYIDDHREKMVDISDRPGGFCWVKGGFSFRGASDYWFGPAFFELVPKAHILAYPYAISIQEIAPDLVHVKLFESVFGGLRDDEVWVHQTFRDHLGIDQLKV
ncbi:MAG: hypothetical protein DA408_19340 [Bacteroidetes bacterium]|nr:MAG: hypothetical protein C7N36_08075 [Bacteroidota bacterium]PTM08980.1 MAG: hypothetical protein DA408_19340 [Bacteroidota bacterium]